MGESSGTRRGNGPGWGGPAKGAGNGNPRTQDAGRDAFTRGMPGDAEARQAQRDEECWEMSDILRDLARSAATPAGTRVQAAVAFQTRHQGMPVQMNVNRQDGGIEVVIQKLAVSDAG